MHTVEGGRTFAESRDFQSYMQNTVGIQHGTPIIAKSKARRGGEEGVSLSQLANGAPSHDRPASRELQVITEC